MSLLAQSLAGTLNPDRNTRVQAELTLSDLFANGGDYQCYRLCDSFVAQRFTSATTSLELATICVTTTEDPSLRQMSRSIM